MVQRVSPSPSPPPIADGTFSASSFGVMLLEPRYSGPEEHVLVAYFLTSWEIVRLTLVLMLGTR